MASPGESPPEPTGTPGPDISTPTGRAARVGKVLVVSSVMLTFLSYWRVAAVVLCDLASSAYYIGGVVEQQIGPAAPWFILAVMVFSYFVRMIYIESCSMFVRGGVYRVVKEAMGGGLAKLSVSALMFDYVLTGPISGVSAGQYVVGLVAELLRVEPPDWLTDYASAGLAIAVTVYFWRVNIRGIHESSDRALKIMGATTVMGVVMIVWCSVTLVMEPTKAKLPSPAPDLSRADQAGSPKVDTEGKPLLDALGRPVDPLGFIGRTPLGASLRPGKIRWFSLLGALGVLIAFGHSILAMSGEETLAQVYREVESPKLANFKKAAFIVFIYSLLLTSLISFFAVMLVPEPLRVTKYSGNLIGGLAMSVAGPHWARLLLNGLVVVVGFLILAGSVNTAIVGSNGVLNRVAEDGVMPEWFLKPHPKFGTTSRIINLVAGLQIFTIVVSRGEINALGEAYAFGVIWSFVFKAMAMLVLRFKRPGKRDYEVPINITVKGFDLPIGIFLIFAVLLGASITNLMTKEVATISGMIFTVVFLAAFLFSERRAERENKAADQGKDHEHLEQFNEEGADEVTAAGLGLTKPFRKLVGVRSPTNLGVLERCLAETDPETTEVVVMTASYVPPASGDYTPKVNRHDRELLTAVVNLAEKVGKPVHPVIMPTNNPAYALTKAAIDLGAGELILGGSHTRSPDAQLRQVAADWATLTGANPRPLTVRVLNDGHDARLDLGGGVNIPRYSEQESWVKRLADLRSSRKGVSKLLIAVDADVPDAVFSFLDRGVAVTLLHVGPKDDPASADLLKRGAARAKELGRKVETMTAEGEVGPAIVRAAADGKFDAVFLGWRDGDRTSEDTAVARHVVQNAPCRVIVGFVTKAVRDAGGPNPPSSPTGAVTGT